MSSDDIVQELHQREELFKHLEQRLTDVAIVLGERLLKTPSNPISLAMTVDRLEGPQNTSATSDNLRRNRTSTFLGSMLWARYVAINQ